MGRGVGLIDDGRVAAGDGSTVDSRETTLQAPALTSGGALNPLPNAEPGVDIADGVLHLVDPAYRDAELLGSWIGFAVIAGGSGVGALVLWLLGGVGTGWGLILSGAWVLLAGWLAWFSAVWPGKEYARTQYALSPEGIEIRKGVVWRRIINVPCSRVQHTDVIQGPIMRRFGIAVLRIHTAGTENAQVDLPGLRHDAALRIRDALLRGRAGAMAEQTDDAV